MLYTNNTTLFLSKTEILWAKRNCCTTFSRN